MQRRRSGQSIVELALALPIIVLFTIGTIELSYYIFMYSELETSARRGAEWAATTPPYTAISTDDVTGGDECAMLIKRHAMDSATISKLQASQITISYPSGNTRKRGDLIQVRINYTGQWLTPIGNRFFGNNLVFAFTARRTILNTEPPPGRQANCT